MKVLMAYAPEELRFVEMDTPKPGPKEVLAKVKFCGICTTDYGIYKGTLKLGDGNDPIYPVRIGHEWSGEVVEVGSETRRLKPGDHVVSDTGYSCGECAACLEGEYQRCEYGKAIGTIGECWPGAMAEYMVVPERLTFNVPKNVSLEEAALVEPSSIGLYGLLRAPTGPGRNLLVIGTGAIGLGGMACAKGIGAGKTLLAGRKDAKLEIGRKMGADILINTTKDNIYDIVMRETDGRGMDVIMDTSGDPEIFNDMMTLLRPSGTLVIPGFYERSLKEVHLNRLIVKNCTLVGAAGTPNMGRKILDMLENGHISLKEMITDRFEFKDALEAFNAISLRNDRRIKIMLKM